MALTVTCDGSVDEPGLQLAQAPQERLQDAGARRFESLVIAA